MPGCMAAAASTHVSDSQSEGEAIVPTWFQGTNP